MDTKNATSTAPWGHNSCNVYCFLEGRFKIVLDPFAETVGRYWGMEESVRKYRRLDALGSIFVSIDMLGGYGGLVTGY